MMKTTLQNSPRRLEFKLRPQFIVYVDGYNLYKSIDHPSTLKLGWCNYRTLAHKLVELAFGYKVPPEDCESVQVKYFTALVRQKGGSDDTGGHRGEESRQQIWLKALRNEAAIDCIEGAHRRNPDGSHREKMTDVNIAIAMCEDARENRPAGMVLVSGDQDFVPAIERVLQLKIPVSVFNPTGHQHYQLTAGIPDRKLFEISDLSQDLMAACPLGQERAWLDYLERKTESYRHSKTGGTTPPYDDYKRLLDLEKRNAKLRSRQV